MRPSAQSFDNIWYVAFGLEKVEENVAGLLCDYCEEAKYDKAGRECYCPSGGDVTSHFCVKCGRFEDIEEFLQTVVYPFLAKRIGG